MFSEDEINNFYYTTVKKPDSYFKKWESVPECPVKIYNYKWQDFDFPRTWCILDFKEWIEKYNIKEIKHLGFTCTTDPELEFLNAEEKTLIKYPPYDLHSIGNSFENEFDFFLFNQTLEHLYNPFQSVAEIFKTVKPGGYVFTSVPTLNIPHCMPIHFNGFTPLGLAMLFKVNGFEVLEIGQWGNFRYIQTLFNTHSWPGYDSLQINGVVENEERNVCQTWILAKKPA
jgi:hypothetical protein